MELTHTQLILASIIQGSGIGPASYVVTASDLHAVTPGNNMVKYADDTYLVVPAANVQSCAAEISNVELWSADNNLSLNRLKSAKIVFVSPRSRRRNCSAGSSRISASRDHQGTLSDH